MHAAGHSESFQQYRVSSAGRSKTPIALTPLWIGSCNPERVWHKRIGAAQSDLGAEKGSSLTGFPGVGVDLTQSSCTALTRPRLAISQRSRGGEKRILPMHGWLSAILLGIACRNSQRDSAFPTLSFARRLAFLNTFQHFFGLFCLFYFRPRP